MNINRGGYTISDQFASHFLTFTVVGWIDIFTRQRYRDIVIQNLAYCIASKGLQLHAYVIMNNHIHFIWTSSNGNLSGLIRDFKSYTTKKVIAAIEDENENESRRNWLLRMFEWYGRQTGCNDFYKMWTSNNHPEEIWSEKFLNVKLNYIHDNPVAAGWVSQPEHYLYSSAVDYAGMKGLVKIEMI